MIACFEVDRSFGEARFVFDLSWKFVYCQVEVYGTE